MDRREELLLTTLAAVAPGIGRWLAGLIDGQDANPTQTRRVRDVLPTRSASEAAADDLRGHREG